MIWVKCRDGGYRNLAVTARLSVAETVGVGWRITVNSNTTGDLLDATYATEAEAREALRKLVNGVDPASLI